MKDEPKEKPKKYIATFFGYITAHSCIDPVVAGLLHSHMKSSSDFECIIEQYHQFMQDLKLFISDQDESDVLSKYYTMTDENWKRLQDLKKKYNEYLNENTPKKKKSVLDSIMESDEK